MTATATEHVAATSGATGRIARVIGPVVDVEFPADAIPSIYNALTTEIYTLSVVGSVRCV